MRFQDNYNKESRKKKFFLFFIFLIFILFFLNYFKVNKFSYIGDTQFVDVQKLKILSLNLLKDQPIFWFNQSRFVENVKNEFPQVKDVSFRIVSSDTLEIAVIAEDICCIIKDSNEKKFVISKNGLVLRDFEGPETSEIKLSYFQSFKLNELVDKNLVNLLYLITTKSVKFEDVKNNEFYLEKDFIYFYTSDSKQVIINENTDLKKFNEDIKSMKSYLQQNQKNYSILDFRFEKIVVK
jgi:cell division septal protein FtsQ